MGLICEKVKVLGFKEKLKNKGKIVTFRGHTCCPLLLSFSRKLTKRVNSEFLFTKVIKKIYAESLSFYFEPR